MDDFVQATTWNFHFVLILVAHMDKIYSVSPLPGALKILIWLACAFVLEASERKTQHIFNTIFGWTAEGQPYKPKSLSLSEWVSDWLTDW